MGRHLAAGTCRHLRDAYPHMPVAAYRFYDAVMAYLSHGAAKLHIFLEMAKQDVKKAQKTVVN